jgi:hypothetical protein
MGQVLHGGATTTEAIRTLFCPATDPRFTYRGEDVVQTLERICGRNGYPKTIRVDNGSDFISRDLNLWAYANNVTLDFSRPGKPTDNGFIEALAWRISNTLEADFCVEALNEAIHKFGARRS